MLPGRKDRWHKGSRHDGLPLILPLRLSRSRKSGSPALGNVKFHRHQIGVQLLQARPCLRDLPAWIRSQCESFSANGSSLLASSGTPNCGSPELLGRYLQIVFRDKPVRRAISRICIRSRRCQRRITLSGAISITPVSLAARSKGRVKTRVKSQLKAKVRPQVDAYGQCDLPSPAL